MNPISRRTFIKGTGLVLTAASLPALLRKDDALLAAGLGADSAARGVPGPGDFLPVAAMNRILSRALARGGDYADLFCEHSAQTNISIANSEIRALQFGILQGGGVRTVEGERTGFAYAELLDEDALLEAADTAAEIAASDARVGAVPVTRIDFPRYVIGEEAIAATGMGEKVALLQRMDHAARAVDPAITQVSIDYSDTVQRFAIATATGELAFDELPVIYLRINVTAERGGERAEGRFRGSRRTGMEYLAGDMPERAGREAARQALLLLDAKPAPSGELPVVVAAGGGVMFHEAVGHGLEADAVIRGATVFAGRVGQKIASELVTLYDDGTLHNERGSFNVDDEALPASKTLLIERGVLVGYMQDRRTARTMGVPTTANGRRQSFRYPAVPRMSNTYVAPGMESAEEIIKSTPRGIYAVHFGGGEVDTASGQFTFGLQEAYLIEDGKVTAPIKGANLVGAGIQVLERIDRVASDFAFWPGTCGKADQWVPVTSGCPTLRISSITVGGTA